MANGFENNDDEFDGSGHYSEGQDEVVVFHFTNGFFLSDFVLDFFGYRRKRIQESQEVNADQTIEDEPTLAPRQVAELYKNLDLEEKQKLIASISKQIGEAIDAQSLSIIQPLRNGNIVEYGSKSQEKLVQTKVGADSFEFQPTPGFSGVLRVKRRGKDGKLLDDSVDIIEYKNGKAVLVIPGVDGQCRIANFGEIQKTADMVIDNGPEYSFVPQSVFHSQVSPVYREEAKIPMQSRVRPQPLSTVHLAPASQISQSDSSLVWPPQSQHIVVPTFQADKSDPNELRPAVKTAVIEDRQEDIKLPDAEDNLDDEQQPVKAQENEAEPVVVRKDDTRDVADIGIKPGNTEDDKEKSLADDLEPKLDPTIVTEAIAQPKKVVIEPMPVKINLNSLAIMPYVGAQRPITTVANRGDMGLAEEQSGKVFSQNDALSALEAGKAVITEVVKAKTDGRDINEDWLIRYANTLGVTDPEIVRGAITRYKEMDLSKLAQEMGVVDNAIASIDTGNALPADVTKLALQDVDRAVQLPAQPQMKRAPYLQEGSFSIIPTKFAKVVLPKGYKLGEIQDVLHINQSLNMPINVSPERLSIEWPDKVDQKLSTTSQQAQGSVSEEKSTSLPAAQSKDEGLDATTQVPEANTKEDDDDKRTEISYISTGDTETVLPDTGTVLKGELPVKQDDTPVITRPIEDVLSATNEEITDDQPVALTPEEEESLYKEADMLDPEKSSETNSKKVVKRAREDAEEESEQHEKRSKLVKPVVQKDSQRRNKKIKMKLRKPISTKVSRKKIAGSKEEPKQEVFNIGEGDFGKVNAGVAPSVADLAIVPYQASMSFPSVDISKLPPIATMPFAPMPAKIDPNSLAIMPYVGAQRPITTVANRGDMGLAEEQSGKVFSQNDALSALEAGKAVITEVVKAKTDGRDINEDWLIRYANTLGVTNPEIVRGAIARYKEMDLSKLAQEIGVVDNAIASIDTGNALPQMKRVPYLQEGSFSIIPTKFAKVPLSKGYKLGEIQDVLHINQSLNMPISVSPERLSIGFPIEGSKVTRVENVGSGEEVVPRVRSPKKSIGAVEEKTASLPEITSEDEKTTKEDMGWQFDEGGPIDDADEVQERVNVEDDTPAQSRVVDQDEEIDPRHQNQEDEELLNEEVPSSVDHTENAVQEESEEAQPRRSIQEVEDEELALKNSFKEDIISRREFLKTKMQELEGEYGQWIEDSKKQDFHSDHKERFLRNYEELQQEFESYIKFIDVNKRLLSEVHKEVGSFNREDFDKNLTSFANKGEVLSLQNDLYLAKQDENLAGMQTGVQKYQKQGKHIVSDVEQASGFDLDSVRHAINDLQDKIKLKKAQEALDKEINSLEDSYTKLVSDKDWGDTSRGYDEQLGVARGQLEEYKKISGIEEKKYKVRIDGLERAYESLGTLRNIKEKQKELDELTNDLHAGYTVEKQDLINSGLQAITEEAMRYLGSQKVEGLGEESFSEESFVEWGQGLLEKVNDSENKHLHDNLEASLSELERLAEDLMHHQSQTEEYEKVYQKFQKSLQDCGKPEIITEDIKKRWEDLEKLHEKQETLDDIKSTVKGACGIVEVSGKKHEKKSDQFPPRSY